MTALPLPEIPALDPAFSVKAYLFDQLDAIEREVRPWLEGTDGSGGPVTIAEAVQIALVMAHKRGHEEAREDMTAAYERGYDAGSDAASEGADYSYADDI